MALDYAIYYKDSEDELNSLMSNFILEEAVESFFINHSIRKISPIKNEILNEMGYEGEYRSYVFLRLNKFIAAEATNALKVFRDKYLGKENSVFLLNGEHELSE